MTPEQLCNELFKGRYIPLFNDLVRELVIHAIGAAYAVEREACAKTAEAQCTWVHDKPYEVQVDMRARIAEAIRARNVGG